MLNSAVAGLIVLSAQDWFSHWNQDCLEQCRLGIAAKEQGNNKLQILLKAMRETVKKIFLLNPSNEPISYMSIDFQQPYPAFSSFEKYLDRRMSEQ